PESQRRSETTTQRTPAIVLVSCVTIMMSCDGLPSLTPRYMYLVPGTTGNHGLFTCVEKLDGGGVAVVAFRCAHPAPPPSAASASAAAVAITSLCVRIGPPVRFAADPRCRT